MANLQALLRGGLRAQGNSFGSSTKKPAMGNANSQMLESIVQGSNCTSVVHPWQMLTAVQSTTKRSSGYESAS
jgi:hypothetical protein